MPSNGSSIRLGLGVMKAKYLQKKESLCEQLAKLKIMRAAMKRKEETWMRWMIRDLRALRVLGLRV